MNIHLVLKNTTSGGIVFNDTFQQLACMSFPISHVACLMWSTVNNIPFGGVGESGCRQICPAVVFTLIYHQSHITDGRQGLRYSFNEFSYHRSVVTIPNEYVFWTCGIWYKFDLFEIEQKRSWIWLDTLHIHKKNLIYCANLSIFQGMRICRERWKHWFMVLFCIM